MSPNISKLVRICVSILNEPEMNHAATAEIVSDPWILDYSAAGSPGVVRVRVGVQIMKYCSGYCGVIRCTTGISMVPKAKTTSSQRHKSCDIATH